MEERVCYASFWQRVGAYLLDHLITALLLSPLIAWYIDGLFGERSGVFLLGYSVPLLLVILLVRLLYVSLFWARTGATIGCRLFHIAIETETGQRLGFARALIRYLGLVACSLLLGLGALLLLFSKKKQMLQDYVARTVVKQVRREPRSFEPKV